MKERPFVSTRGLLKTQVQFINYTATLKNGIRFSNSKADNNLQLFSGNQSCSVANIGRSKVSCSVMNMPPITIAKQMTNYSIEKQ